MIFAERVRQAARGLDTFNAKSLADAMGVRTDRERVKVWESIKDFYKRGEMTRIARGRYRYRKMVKPATIRQRLWDVIRRMPAATIGLDDLEQLTGCNRDTIKDFCDWLVREGYVVRPRRGKLMRVKDFGPVAPKEGMRGRNGEDKKVRKHERRTR